MPFDAPVELDAVVAEVAEALADTRLISLRAGSWPPSARSSVDIGAFLSRLDCPLLFAEHEGCLASTDEGFEDAAATFARRALCQ